ncbi:MAG: hypothetical protein ABIQ75_10305 [Flavobacteriales bacterium]
MASINAARTNLVAYVRRFPSLAQVFPANQTLRSSMLSRGDMWVLYAAFIDAYP